MKMELQFLFLTILTVDCHFTLTSQNVKNGFGIAKAKNIFKLVGRAKKLIALKIFLGKMSRLKLNY